MKVLRLTYNLVDLPLSKDLVEVWGVEPQSAIFITSIPCHPLSSSVGHPFLQEGCVAAVQRVIISVIKVQGVKPRTETFPIEPQVGLFQLFKERTDDLLVPSHLGIFLRLNRGGDTVCGEYLPDEGGDDDEENGDDGLGGGVHGGGVGLLVCLHAIYKQIIIYKLHEANFFKGSFSVSFFRTHQAKYTLRDRGRVLYVPAVFFSFRKFSLPTVVGTSSVNPHPQDPFHGLDRILSLLSWKKDPLCTV